MHLSYDAFFVTFMLCVNIKVVKRRMLCLYAGKVISQFLCTYVRSNAIAYL